MRKKSNTVKMNFLIKLVGAIFVSGLFVNANTLVWTTLCDSSIEFCDHVYGQDSPHYTTFFDTITNVAHSLTEPLEKMQLISNIILARPDSIPCHPYIVHLIIETHHETPELRLAIKDFANRIQERTKTAIRVLLKIQDITQPFKLWNAHKGLYILCKEDEGIKDVQSTANPDEPSTLVSSNPLMEHEKAIIEQLARRRRVEIQSTWKEHDLICVSINAFGSSTKIQHFQRDLEYRLRSRVRLILN